MLPTEEGPLSFPMAGTRTGILGSHLMAQNYCSLLPTQGWNESLPLRKKDHTILGGAASSVHRKDRALGCHGITTVATCYSDLRFPVWRNTDWQLQLLPSGSTTPFTRRPSSSKLLPSWGLSLFSREVWWSCNQWLWFRLPISWLKVSRKCAEDKGSSCPIPPFFLSQDSGCISIQRLSLLVSAPSSLHMMISFLTKSLTCLILFLHMLCWGSRLTYIFHICENDWLLIQFLIKILSVLY